LCEANGYEGEEILQAPAIENSVYPMGLREFQIFRTLIHKRTGIWLRDGKQVMLASRLSRRLRHHGMADFAEYYGYVQTVPDDSEEIRELINCVTTNKTSFFRERHHFDFLAGTVVPEVRAAALRGAPRTIRIWSAASSTGEEAYSIAITLLEELRTAPNHSRTTRSAYSQGSPKRAGLPGIAIEPGSWKIEIVASDIDTKVLDTARRAIYGDDSLASIAPPLKKKYFLRGKDDMRGRVKLKPAVTQLVQFKRINLQEARWPLEGLFDVIFFRNALIYFNHDTQDIFLRKMMRYLKPGGYLFLGNAEHIPWLHDVLEPLNRTMYRLRDSER
jgi:chemotaxis protein methyltransferase CheR